MRYNNTMKCAQCGKKKWDSDPALLHFMRHGKTAHNEKSICTSSLDEPLSELGVSQARSIGIVMRESGMGISAIVSSPMKRAWRTAEIIGEESLGLEIIRDDRLRERCVGVLEGKPETPESDAKLLLPDYLPEGATPLVVFERETGIFLDDCAKGGFESGTLFITHSFRLLTIIKLIKCLTVEQMYQHYQPPGNCKVVTFGVANTPCSHCRSSFLVMDE